jgi:hypothetical protein
MHMRHAFEILNKWWLWDIGSKLVKKGLNVRFDENI